MAKQTPLDRMRAICLALPDTREDEKWGKPHFCVGDKIFSGCGEHDGVTTIGFKLAKPHAAERVKDPRFWPSPYVGKHGWVSTDANAVRDWDEIRELVLESCRLIASKRSLKKLGDATSSSSSSP